MVKLSNTLILVSATFFTVMAETNFFGYFSLYYENVGPMKNGDGILAGQDEKGDPGEFDYANFILMVQSNVTDNVRAYASLKGPGDIGLQTYWGEYVYRDYLKLRTGKVYRPFGQFNELLDAVPTYLGMEPPELFDNDHLMLPRHGKIMVHGGVDVKNNYLRYAYMLDSDENMLSSNNKELTLSHSWDVNFSVGDMLTVGNSGFVANEQNGSATGLGEGSPRTGVLPWMENDRYYVTGAYLKFKLKGLTLKSAYWLANHDARRNPAAVMEIYANTGLNGAQLKNFFGNEDFNEAPASVTAGDVRTKAEFTVSTYYIRLGYTFSRGLIDVPVLKYLEITPYLFWDSYTNPETIASKTWGGDNEAGIADDGTFYKPTLGVTIKPTPFMAFKIDGSSHIQEQDGERTHYEEIRMDLSYFFK